MNNLCIHIVFNCYIPSIPRSRAISLAGFEILAIARQNRAPIRCCRSSKRSPRLNQHTLSQRLERVAAHIPCGARLADIGSDHAYLPVALMRRGLLSMAVAGEVAATPFHAAQRSVRDNGLEGSISVRLASGLKAIEAQDRIDVISLCGMGGETIRDILEADQARLSGEQRLVLQPNGGEQPLRLWLMEHGYRIVAEEVLRENRFDYEIIVAEPGGALRYSAEELYFGPLSMRERSPAFVAKWQRLLRLKRKTLEGLTKARQPVPEEKARELAEQIGWISELLG